MSKRLRHPPSETEPPKRQKADPSPIEVAFPEQLDIFAGHHGELKLDPSLQFTPSKVVEDRQKFCNLLALLSFVEAQATNAVLCGFDFQKSGQHLKFVRPPTVLGFNRSFKEFFVSRKNKQSHSLFGSTHASTLPKICGGVGKHCFSRTEAVDSYQFSGVFLSGEGFWSETACKAIYFYDRAGILKYSIKLFLPLGPYYGTRISPQFQLQISTEESQETAHPKRIEEVSDEDETQTSEYLTEFEKEMLVQNEYFLPREEETFIIFDDFDEVKEKKEELDPEEESEFVDDVNVEGFLELGED